MGEECLVVIARHEVPKQSLPLRHSELVSESKTIRDAETSSVWHLLLRLLRSQ